MTQRREWVPNIKLIADELVSDYQNAEWALEGIGAEGVVTDGDNDAVGTLASWIAAAKEHGEEFTEDDWVTLAMELARRAAGVAIHSAGE